MNNSTKRQLLCRHPFIYRKWVTAALLLWWALCLALPAAAQDLAVSHPQLPLKFSSIKIFDNKGRYVGRILPEQRYWVSIDRIHPFLKKAVVAIEDARFYEHPGIDVRGIARALVKDVAKGRIVEGGSTITQQLIKNKYLSGKKTLDRKIQEVSLAMEYERKYTKDQILEMYLNEIYYGNGAWGIAQASLLYFDKTPAELTEAECALLAGVPKAPNRYNPFGKAADAGKRRNLVLKRMSELKMIPAGKKKKLTAAPIVVFKRGEAPFYIAHVKSKLVERFGQNICDRGGLEITASLDLDLQRKAERYLREGIRKISPDLQGALICLDATTGDVLAAAGGVDFAKSSYDRAYIARRQPGSAIKPFIYAAALEKGFTAASVWNDSAVSYNRGAQGSWTPQNYEGKSQGELSLRKALAYSNNVIAVKLLEAVGVPYFVNFASREGLALRSPNDLSLALGTDDVTLAALVQAYTPLANGGSRVEARSISRVYDKYYRTWIENPSIVTPVLNPATAFITTSMMKDVLSYGTAKRLKKFSQERPSAGKTGTTDNYQDAWFIGYTPQIITGIWAGHDKPKPGGAGFTGGNVCAPIWERFMRSALAGKPATDFRKPDTVVSISIDPSTGYLAVPDCPVKRDEFYLAGTQPTLFCPRHGGDSLNSLPPVISPPGEQGQQKQPPFLLLP